MKYYIISGEASGDLHGSNLMKHLLAKDPEAQIRFWGGDCMSSLKGQMVKHYREITAMGIVEVIAKLPSLIKNIRYCKEDIKKFNPDVLIPVDFPGFNFRISKFASKTGIPVFYYIPPTVWAWKEWRLKKLAAFSTRIYVIFPFEPDFYRKRGYKVHYFGNPLLDSISEDKSFSGSREDFFKIHNLEDKPTVALLAGSRESEIKKLMPIYAKLPSHFPEYQFMLAGAPSMTEKDYSAYLTDNRIKLLFGNTYPILRYSHASVVCSGTASLEAAILDTPNIICYKANKISVFIARRLIKVKYVGLANLILNREVVKELLQENCTEENVVRELKKVLEPKTQRRMKQKFANLKQMLGDKGASERIAESMISGVQEIIENKRYSKTYKSPIGLLKLVSDGESLLEVTYLKPESEEAETSTNKKKKEIQKVEVLEEAQRQLEEYFREERKVFDLPLKLNGTKFQNQVWEELRKIPFGHIKTYGEIASIVDTSDASRAVGNACKMNPLLIVVPCHRVLGVNNKLTGFNIGLEKKSFLLDLEKAYVNADINLFSKTQKEEKDEKGSI